MYRVLVWWFILVLGYWRFFSPHKFAAGMDAPWYVYGIGWLFAMLVSVGGTYGLFGLTVQRFELILVRDGLFMFIVVTVDYLYGDALPN